MESVLDMFDHILIVQFYPKLYNFLTAHHILRADFNLSAEMWRIPLNPMLRIDDLK